MIDSAWMHAINTQMSSFKFPVESVICY